MIRYVDGKLDEKSLLYIEYEVECPVCEKKIPSYGDFTCYCRDCKIGFHMSVHKAKSEKVDAGIKWSFEGEPL